MMAEMLISSDRGLVWGNIVITPRELADHILGIDIVDELLVLDGVKFVNHVDREYIVDQEGKRHKLSELLERIQNGNLH